MVPRPPLAAHTPGPAMSDELVADPTRPAPRTRRPVRLLLVAVLAAAGGAYGRQAVLPVRTPAPPVEAPPAEPLEPETAARKTDLMLRSGRYADALRLLAAAPADAFPTDRAKQYRVAVAHEGRGKWAAAAAAYRTAAGPDSDPGEWARAALGQARCAAAAGDLDAAGRS
jgi:tetratricopeptide (TPR) repeat protein